MAVGRRAVLASAAASLAAPAFVRLARGDALPHVTFKLHHAFSAVSCVHANFLAPWARSIETQSDGRVRIDIFPSMTLGGQPAELFDQARSQVADIVWAMPSDTPGRFPKIELFELPFIASRRALVSSKAIEDFSSDNLKDEFRDIRPLCFACADRGILHANRPVETVAQVRGLRLDVGTRFAAAAVAVLGGQPVPMPSGQLPFAITRRVVDGAIVPWDAVPALKLDTLLKAHTDFADLTLGTTTAVLAMNKASYQKLPPDLKAVIDANSGQIAASMAGAMWDLKAKAVSDAVSQSGGVIVTLDADAVARWRKATQPVIDAWRKEMKARKADGDRLLASARALFEKYASVPEPQPPEPPRPPVTEAKAQPNPPAKADAVTSAPPPAPKAAAAPAPRVSVAAPPQHLPPPPASAPATHWWQFWKSTPVSATASTAPQAQPTHWWQFWRTASTPAPAAASAPATPVVPAVPAPIHAAPPPAAPAAALVKPPPAPMPLPPKSLDIPL